MNKNNGSSHTPSETGKVEGETEKGGKDDDDTNSPVKIRVTSVSDLSAFEEEQQKGHFPDEERQSSGDGTGHPHPMLSDEISILIATFNIGNAPLDPTELSHWLPLSNPFTAAASDIQTPNSKGPDVVVLGLQESFYRRKLLPVSPKTDVKQQQALSTSTSGK